MCFFSIGDWLGLSVLTVVTDFIMYIFLDFEFNLHFTLNLLKFMLQQNTI